MIDIRQTDSSDDWKRAVWDQIDREDRHRRKMILRRTLSIGGTVAAAALVIMLIPIRPTQQTSANASLEAPDPPKYRSATSEMANTYSFGESIELSGSVENGSYAALRVYDLEEQWSTVFSCGAEQDDECTEQDGRISAVYNPQVQGRYKLFVLTADRPITPSRGNLHDDRKVWAEDEIRSGESRTFDVK